MTVVVDSSMVLVMLQTNEKPCYEEVAPPSSIEAHLTIGVGTT